MDNLTRDLMISHSSQRVAHRTASLKFHTAQTMDCDQ